LSSCNYRQAPAYLALLSATLKDLKAYINVNTVVVGDFNTPLSSIDRSSKQKINKEILDLKYTIDQMDLLDVYRTFHPTSTQYTFFTAAHGTFFKIDHIPRAQSKPQQI
jgi:exonuclease III